MKKTLHSLTAFLFLCLFTLSNANSESLEIYNHEMVDNGSKEKPIKFYAGIKNLTDEQKNIKIDVKFLDLTEGHEIECCAGIMCLPASSEDFTIGNLPPIGPNSSTDPDFLEAKLYHNGIEGTTTVRYDFYVSDDPYDKVDITVDYNVGVSGVNELSGFAYHVSEPYPNPAKDVFHISYGLPMNAVDPAFSLFDVNGNLIKSIDLQSGSNVLTVNTSDLPSGKYFYQIRSNGHILESNTIIAGH